MRDLRFVPTLLVVLGILWVPAAAGAATVSVVEERCDRNGCSGTTHYAAAQGEVNALEVRVEGESMTFRDVVPVRAGAGCEQVDATTARCRRVRPFVELFDGNDRLDLVVVVAPTLVGTETGTAPLRATLGPGDDTASGGGAVQGEDGADALTGGPGNDSLSGDGGDDRLAGGDGDDVLSGGPGRDAHDGGAGDDLLGLADGFGSGAGVPDGADGGPGRDTASWGGAPVGVVVDLADPGPDGPRGAPDVVTGVENANGTDAADRLSGDDGPNELDAGRGADVVEGRSGDDALETGAGGRGRLLGGDGNDELRATGADAMAGGAGDDRLVVRGSGPRNATRACGAGDDLLFALAGGVRLPRDCERFAFAGMGRGVLELRVVRPLTGRTVALRASCAGTCPGTLTMRPARRGRWVSRARLPSLRTERTLRLPVPRARRPLVVRIAWLERRPGGPPYRAGPVGLVLV